MKPLVLITVLLVVLGTIGMSFKSSDGIVPNMTDSTWTNGWHRVYNVKLFGATGNGSSDDTASIQSAINAADLAGGGTVYFPNGVYRLNTGLLVGSETGQHFINLAGETSINSKLLFAGATNGVAVTLLTDKYSSITDLTIQRTGGTNTTEGLVLTGNGPGTQSNGGYIRNVLLSGFRVCINSGPKTPYTGTSSEWTFDNVTFQSSYIGFYNGDFNGLNFSFRQLQASTVDYVIYGATAGIMVDGGSFSSCGTGLYLRNGGTYAVRNLRSEAQKGPFVDCGSTVLIENCIVQGMIGAATNNAIQLFRAGDNAGHAAIRSCHIGGRINATNLLSIEISQTGVYDTQVAHLSPGSSIGATRFTGNWQNVVGTAQTVSFFPDEIRAGWNGLISAYTVNATNGFESGSVLGITTTWTNMIPNVITQRISSIGGIVVTNLTL